MTGIIGFHALAFDLVDGHLVEGTLVDCGSPALAIQTAQGQWKVLGHVGAGVQPHQLLRQGKSKRHVLRRFGQVPMSI